MDPSVHAQSLKSFTGYTPKQNQELIGTVVRSLKNKYSTVLYSVIILDFLMAVRPELVGAMYNHGRNVSQRKITTLQEWSWSSHEDRMQAKKTDFRMILKPSYSIFMPIFYLIG